MLKKHASLAQIAVGAFMDELEKLSELRERNLSVAGAPAPAPAQQTYKDAPATRGRKAGVLTAPAVPTPGSATTKAPAPAAPPA
jgi:hypothetical protein